VELANSYFPGREWGSGSGTRLRFDPSRAKSLISQSGYVLHGEDKRFHRNLLRKVDERLRYFQPFALGWYHDHVKVLYWNSLSAPATYLSRVGSPADVLQYWWFDEEKIKALKQARRAKKTIPDDEVVVDPWKRKK